MRNTLFAAACILFGMCAPTQTDAQTAAASRLISASDLATIVDLDGLSVSHDGQHIAFQTRVADPSSNRYVQTWYVMASTGGAARRLGDGGEPMQAAPSGRVNGTIRTPPAQWSPDDEWLVYHRRVGGETQIWRVTKSGRLNERLIHNIGDIGALIFSQDGQHLIFEASPTRRDIAISLQREGLTGFQYDRRFFPAYSTLPLSPLRTAGADASSQPPSRDIWVYQIGARSMRRANEDERAEFSSRLRSRAGLPSNARGLVTQSQPTETAAAQAWTAALDPSLQGGFAPLTIVSRSEDGSELTCSYASCTAQRMHGLWWRSANELIFARGEGPLLQDTALYAWRPGSTSPPRLVLRTEAKLVGATYEWECAMSGDRLVCFYETANYPRRIVSVDLDSGAIDILHDPNPQFSQFDRGPTPRRISVTTPSGAETYAYLVLPPHLDRTMRLPLVVVTYRCNGFLRGGTGDEYPIFPLAAQGFAVLCYNAADTDYERLAHMNAEAYQNWARGPGAPEKRRVQEALDLVISQLVSEGIVDAERIGLTGLSFGAEIVSYALFSSHRVTAAIASGPGFEPSSYYLYGPTGREQLQAWGLGAPQTTPERWREFSLTPNAHRVRAPLLLNVSDHELLSAIEPVTALEDAQRSVEMHVYPDEYHVKSQPAHRLSIYQRNIDWMNFWLRDVVDESPEKAFQYARWRALRARVSVFASAGPTAHSESSQ